jgi:hypothetical protein
MSVFASAISHIILYRCIRDVQHDDRSVVTVQRYGFWAPVFYSSTTGLGSVR